MRSTSKALLGVTLCFCVGSTAAAQESIQLESGARVRLSSSALSPDHRVVRIVSAANDSVAFRPERNPVIRTLALSDISAVDVSLGKKRQTLNGAVIGMAAGIGVGAILGYSTFDPCVDCWLGPSSASEAAVWGGAAAGILGLVAGTTIGFFVKSERWQRVQPNTRITVARLREARGLAVSFAF